MKNKEKEGGNNPSVDAVQLEIEMEKRKIREEIIASEYREIQQLEIKMESKMEKQIMGSSNGDFREKLKVIDPSISRVDDLQQISSDPLEIHGVAIGNRAFDKNPNVGGKSVGECVDEEGLGQVIPCSGISGTKRKAEKSVTIDEETTLIASKESQKKKWYCSLCDFSATSAGGWNLHIHSKKHKSKEALTTSSKTAGNISTVSFSAEAQPTEEQKAQVEPIGERKAQLQPVEEHKAQFHFTEEQEVQLQPIEEQEAQLQPMEVQKAKYQSIENENIHVQPMEVQKAKDQSIEDENIQVPPMEEQKAQLQPTEVEKAQLQPIEERKAQLQPMEVQKAQEQSIEDENSQVQHMEEQKAQLQRIEEQKAQVQPVEEQKAQLQHTEEQKAQLQSTEEKKAQIQPMEEDTILAEPEEKEKTETTKKWECSLCQVSATSEILLRSHLQGRKHRSKEAQLRISQGINEVKEKNEVSHKWFCSLCNVSAASENNLIDHIKGKKHKSKAGLLKEEDVSVDSKIMEEVKAKVNTLNSVKMGIDGNTSNEEGKKREIKCKENVETEKLEEIGIGVIRELVKVWFCKTCNEEANNEEEMANHRKSNKHMNKLRKNGGGVIVVTSMMKEVVEG